jgi:predicted acetyltransferase
LSKLRSASFGGLVLEQRLAALGQTPQCGLQVVDLNTGAVVHSLEFTGVVEELFDVVVLPDVRRPATLGFKEEAIDRLINFPGSGGLITTKPTVKRSGIGTVIQVAGLPRLTQLAASTPASIKYQRVYHLTPDNLLPYEALTFPSLQQHWQTKLQRGELHGVSASVDGEMIGFIVAEQVPQDSPEKYAIEVLSLFVLPAYRRQGIATALTQCLQQALKSRL